MQLNCNSKNGLDVVNFLSTQWSTDGSTSSEPMGLCITSMVKTLTDNHTLDDRNHQGHHTTLLQSETLLPAAQASLCFSEVKSLESTRSLWGEFWSHISICIVTGYRLNKSLHLMTWRSKWSCASGFATRLTMCQTSLTISGFRTRHIFCYQVALTLRITFSGIAHPLSSVSKGRYTLWSAQPGWPYPSMASLGHSGSRATRSSLWRSTPSGMSRCLASSGQHLVDREGSSGPSSGSSRMVLPPTPQTNYWHGYGSVSLTDWSATGVTQSGRSIYRIWTPQIFICGDTLKTGCLATTPRPSLTWRQQSQQP